MSLHGNSGVLSTRCPKIAAGMCGDHKHGGGGRSPPGLPPPRAERPRQAAAAGAVAPAGAHPLRRSTPPRRAVKGGAASRRLRVPSRTRVRRTGAASGCGQMRPSARPARPCAGRYRPAASTHGAGERLGRDRTPLPSLRVRRATVSRIPARCGQGLPLRAHREVVVNLGPLGRAERPPVQRHQVLSERPP